MLTAGLALAVLLLFVAVVAVCLLWRAAAGEVIRLAVQAAGYRAELDALSIAPPSAAVAALTPDDPMLLPAEVEQWLREGAN